MSPRPVRMWRQLALLLALVVLAAACGGDDDDGTAGGGSGTGASKELSGAIAIDGSSTVAPISEAIAEEFRREASGVSVSVGTSGTGGGFKKFCAGETDISDASRAIADEEKEACASAGVEYEEFRVGLDGLAVATSAENEFLECLDLDQLAMIFKDGGASKWNEIDPAFPASDIEIFAPGTDSGTYDYFVEEVLGEEAKPRTDYTASEDDNVLVQGMKGEKNSWGFFGFAYFIENEDVLTSIAVEGEDGECVTPSDETVESGDYPLSRPLFIYVSKEALARPEVKEFVRFYLEITPDIIGDVGYTKAPDAEYEDGLERLEATT